HTHTQASASAFFPSWTVLPPGPPRSSGQLVSARGPSETSVFVRDGHEFCYLYANRMSFDHLHVMCLAKMPLVFGVSTIKLRTTGLLISQSPFDSKSAV